MSHQAESSCRRTDGLTLWAYITLLLLVLGVFAPVVHYGFLGWDDVQAISQNRYLTPPTWTRLGQIWGDFTLWFYVPVTYTAWWLLAHLAYTPTPTSAFGSMAAWPFHAANVVAHAANVAIVFALLRRFGMGRLAAWFGAAVFAVHPMQVEAVAWISTLYTSLSTTFALIALMIYLRFSDERIKPDTPDVKLSPRYALATLCFLLSLLTKPSHATLPLVIAAIEFALRGRRLKQLQPLLPWVFLSGAAVLVTREAQHAWEIYSPLWLRPLVAADAIAFYLYKFFIPVGLTPVYERTPAWLAQSGWVVRLTWLVPIVIVVLAVVLRRRWLFVTLVILFATLAPNLGFVLFNFQRYSTVADRYFYSAMMVMAWLVAAAIQRSRSRAVIATAIVVVLALATGSSLQLRKWKSMQALFGNPNGPDVSQLIYEPDSRTP